MSEGRWASLLIRKIFLVAIIFVALSGLAYLIFTKRSEEAHGATFVVLAGDKNTCLIKPPHWGEGIETDLAGLPLAAIKETAKIGSSALGSYLEEVSNDTSSRLETAELPVFMFEHLSATTASDFPNGIECLVIAHGILGDFDPGTPPKSLLDHDRQRLFDPGRVFSSAAPGPASYAALRALHFRDYPLSYFQFHLMADPSHSFFEFGPDVVYFRRSIASEAKNSKKSIEITISLSRPTSTGTIDAAANSSSLIMQTPIALNDLSPGLVSHVDDLNGSNSINTQREWFSLSNLPGPDAISKLQGSLGHLEIKYAPSNLSVTYKETAQPSMMLKFVGSALKDRAK